MQPTFTGIKNIGYFKTSINHAAMNIIKENDEGWQRIRQVPGPEFDMEEGYLLNIQLTDDYNGKHYTQFREALKKAGLSFSEYRNPVNKDFLNIFISREIQKENGREFKNTDFVINGKELPLVDKNLSFFSYMAKLIRNIAQKPLKEFVVNNDYLDSEDLSKGMCFGNDLYAIFGKDYYDEVRAMHMPATVKSGARDMDKVIDSTMKEYFA